MTKYDIPRFSQQFETEIREVREDLSGLPLDIPNLRVGDAGCGWGYITWCLWAQIPNSDCVALDKFEPDDPPELDLFGMQQFTFATVRDGFEEVRSAIVSGGFDRSVPDLLKNFRNTAPQAERFPTVRRVDLVTGENLIPDLEQTFDVIYCKRVLYNFVDYGSQDGGAEKIRQAIKNMARILRWGGSLCLVEIAGWTNPSDLEDPLRDSGFTFQPPRQVIRPYKTLLGISPFPYNLYHCRRE